jgi:hypothetical protein
MHSGLWVVMHGNFPISSGGMDLPRAMWRVYRSEPGGAQFLVIPAKAGISFKEIPACAGMTKEE